MELSKSVLRVMNVLWDNGDSSAKAISEVLAGVCGWNKNTTYTVIRQCEKKGLLERREPGYLCHALLTREEAQRAEVDSLMERLFQNSPKLLLSALAGGGKLSAEERAELRRLIDELE